MWHNVPFSEFSPHQIRQTSKMTRGVYISTCTLLLQNVEKQNLNNVRYSTQNGVVLLSKLVKPSLINRTCKQAVESQWSHLSFIYWLFRCKKSSFCQHGIFDSAPITIHAAQANLIGHTCTQLTNEANAFHLTRLCACDVEMEER